jgi:uncharacterized protein (UPF0332 family)
VTPQELMAKAQRALTSAQTLLDDQDTDGACNRAYYAMFDAARAALLAIAAPVPPEIAKTHSGLISAFSLHLIKTSKLPAELGKALNKVEGLRLVSDYKGDSISLEDSQWAVAQANAFVHAIVELIDPHAS